VMGEFLMETGEFDAANQCFLDCLEMRRELLGYDHDEVASTLCTVAMALFHQQSYEKSLEYLKEALQFRRAAVGDDDILVGEVLQMGGLVHLANGDTEKAMMLLWDCLRICELNNDKLKMAATWSLIGQAHASNEELDQAIAAYEEAVLLRKSVPGNHVSEEDILEIGKLYDDLGRHKNAIDSYETVLQMRKATYGDNDERVASILHDIGALHFRNGDRDKGERAFSEFIRIRKLHGVDDDPELANALFTIGNILAVKGEKEKAHTLWVDALHIYTTLGLGDDHPVIMKLRRYTESGIPGVTRRPGPGMLLQQASRRLMEQTAHLRSSGAVTSARNMFHAQDGSTRNIDTIDEE